MSIKHYCDICGDMIVNIKPNTELIMFNQGDTLLDIKMDLCSECRIKIIEKIRDDYNCLYALYHMTSDIPTPEPEEEPKKWTHVSTPDDPKPKWKQEESDGFDIESDIKIITKLKAELARLKEENLKSCLEKIKKHVHRTDGSVLEYMPGDPK